MMHDNDTFSKLSDECEFIGRFLTWARKYQVFLAPGPHISYRGIANSNWPLLPSLCRHNFPLPFLRQLEPSTIQQFREKFALADWNDIDVLAYARHHGAPTRLLDWSQNPLVGLWFSVDDKLCDHLDGVIYQLVVFKEQQVSICPTFTLQHAEACNKGKSVHLFAASPKIERSNRQRSIFSITTFNRDAVLQPLDAILGLSNEAPLRRFVVPAILKPKLRQLLTDLGLDAFSIYGGPDWFGKALANQFEEIGKTKLPRSPGET